MYRRPKFLEILHEIREQMSREADYDMDLFAELARSGKNAKNNSSVNFEMPSEKGTELWNVELHDTKN
jgi:hypothetical protein